ncbi:MAG: hypothetical protein ACK4FG_01300 [Brevundimonas sp.]
MKLDPQKALVVYSGALTAVIIGVMVSGAVQGVGPARFTEIDVQRINVREPDGTLRMVISNQTSFPEIPYRGREIPHPGRDTAGMLFMNEEGTEVGGLIFGGKDEDGVRSSGGSLTFDGYEQDQTVQLMGSQRGQRRVSGLVVTDRPEEPIDYAVLERLEGLSPEAQQAAMVSANMGGSQRAFLGRQGSGASELVLRDAGGKARLVLSVAADGTARIAFMDETGRTTRVVTPEGDQP